MLIAAVSRLIGRKASFMLGGLALASGGALAAIALYRADFWMFAASLMLIGMSSGFTQKIRFAAADASPSFYKPRAISWILAGGIVSAIVGSQVAILAKNLLAPVLFAGSFVALVPLGLLAVVVLGFVRLPALARGEGKGRATGRPLRDIILTQRFITGMICGIGLLCADDLHDDRRAACHGGRLRLLARHGRRSASSGMCWRCSHRASSPAC